MTPAPTLIKCFHARPDLGAIRPYVPSGTLICKSVFINAFPCGGMQYSYALQNNSHKIYKFFIEKYRRNIYKLMHGFCN